MTPDELYRKNFAGIDWSVTIQTYQAPKYRGPRSVFACPQIVRDDIGELRSMQDGKIYDSRSAYYQSLKDGGSRIIEAGEEPVAKDAQGDKITKHEIAAALNKVKQGYKPEAPIVPVNPNDE